MGLRRTLIFALLTVSILLLIAGAACGDDSLQISLPTPTPPQGLLVYVTGEVVNPGVYTLPLAADRIADAIEAAGGFTQNADVDSLNLAAKLTDGQQVRVLALGEAGSDININTASLELLQTLTGIGPVRAQAIIDYREANGPFRRIEDILSVQGIGEKTFEAIRDQITVE
ncbi:MAG: helix-hairpin-helix domain-containing protein [Dehalococcoidia bacterium]